MNAYIVIKRGILNYRVARVDKNHEVPHRYFTRLAALKVAASLNKFARFLKAS